MPEGPSIVIAKEAMQECIGKKILKVKGNAKIDLQRMEGKSITDIKSWGKHLLLCFEGFTLRVHFLMFGSYVVNNSKEGRVVRLGFTFKKGELNIYTAAVKVIEEPLDEIYDWTADVMNQKWDAKAAKKKLKALPGMLVCDALLNQEIFSGVGNIIKNEVLFRTKIHPESTVGALPVKQLNALLKEAVNYTFEFLKWKKENTLKKHWEAYAKKVCPRDKVPFKKEYLGKTKRRTFFCDQCQLMYT